jgi:hypothetical protein
MARPLCDPKGRVTFRAKYFKDSRRIEPLEVEPLNNRTKIIYGNVIRESSSKCHVIIKNYHTVIVSC